MAGTGVDVAAHIWFCAGGFAAGAGPNYVHQVQGRWHHGLSHLQGMLERDSLAMQ